MPVCINLPRIVRLLYTHNPFYVISAACIMYAIKLAFRPDEVAYIDPWALMASMGAYTVVMAFTGFLVVKLGHVWEDARMIFLVLLLLFLATSVTFDELLNLNPDQGKLLINCGFGLAVFVTEGLLLGLHIRLPALFRIPYYIWLGLMYHFPIWVSPEITGLSPLATSWRLTAFPLATAGMVLTLLPAVRQGAGYCSRNGTPWSWPLYPWTLFGFIAVATMIRTYALTISFLPSDGMDTAFQPYFLVPFLFAVVVLLLEMGFIEHRPRLVSFALQASPALLLLAWPNTRIGGPSADFLQSLVQHVGSPLWITTWGLAALQGLAALRGVVHARRYLLAALLPLIWISRSTVGFETLSPPQSWPLIVIGCLEVVRAVRTYRSWPALIGSLCLAMALSNWLWDSNWFLYRRIIPYHVALAAVLLIGGLFADPLARALRAIGSLLLGITAAVSFTVAQDLLISHATWGAYLATLVVATLACWYWTRDRAFLYTLLLMTIGASSGSIYLTSLWLKRVISGRVLLPLTLGVLSFIAAAMISAAKAGVGRRWLERWHAPRDSGDSELL